MTRLQKLHLFILLVVAGASQACVQELHAQYPAQQLLVSQKISGSAAACTPMTGYLHCRVLTIDHTQVGGSTLSSFPVLVNTNYGGNAQSASCYDHVYTSDQGGTTLIPWEQEHCNPPAVVVDWVLIASISSSADTIFYVSYDNAAITTPQNTGANGPTHVWDTNYQLVAHLVSNVTVTDSTSNANTCTVNGTVTSATGQISLGTATNGTAANFIGCGAGVQVAAQALTLSGWVKSGAVNVGWVINKNFDGTRVPYGIGSPGSTEPGMSFYDGAWHSTGIITDYRNDGLFHFLVGTFDGATLKYYFDGAATPETTLSYSGSTGTGTGVVGVGEYINNAAAWNGSLDEVRVSNSVRPSNWIVAEWKNQKTSSTFLTVGAEI